MDALSGMVPLVPSAGIVGGVRISVLGPLRAESDASPCLLPSSRKARAILGYVALAGGRAVRRTTLAGLLWDRVPERQARNNLRQALSDLTLSLAASGREIVSATRDELRFRASEATVDVLTLEAGSELPLSIVGGEPAQLLQDLDDLSRSFDEWLAAERTRTENRVRKVLESRLDRLMSAGAPALERLLAARALVASDPAHERAWRASMQALSEMGDVGQALREYRACEESLRRLLAASPSAETRAFREALRGGSLPASATGPRPPEAAPERRASIAVLPLAAPPSDEVSRLVADGIAEGVIHTLSRIGDLLVIARGTSMTYAGRVNDPREVGRDLGVRYVVSGRIAERSGRRRAYVELVEAASGRVIRTDRFDLKLAELFEIQDRIAAEIATTLAPTVRLEELERARRQPPGSLSAYEALLRGLDHMYVLERETFEEGGRLLRRAVDIDPGYAAARSHSAAWRNFRVAQGWSPAPRTDADLAAHEADAALARDGSDVVALAMKGQTLSFAHRDYRGARAHLDRALEAGPSFPMAWALSSATHGWTGDGRLAVEHASQALRLSPQDPFAFFAEHMLSQGHYVAGDYPEAVRWGRRAAARNPRLTSNLRTLAAALVASGDRDGAREVAGRVLRVEPSFSLRRFVARTPFCEELRDLHASRLRAAGLPD